MVAVRGEAAPRVARAGVAALAADDLAFYRSLPDGTVVGFVIPTRVARVRIVHAQ